jgi:AraC family transcriptional activator of mtrCDE
MDALSGLLALYPMKATVENYGLLGPTWAIEKTTARYGSVVFHVVLEGEAVLSTSRQPGIMLKAGDIVVFPKGASHKLASSARKPSNSRDGGDTLLSVNGGSKDRLPQAKLLCGIWEFESDHTNLLLASLPEQIIVRAGLRSETLSLDSLTTMIGSAIDNDAPGSESFIKQLVAALLPLVIRAWLADARSGGGLFAVLADARLHPTIQGILEAPEKPWTMADMAAVCSMSRATFARHFREISGTTPAVVLTQVRMAHARVRLIQGQVIAEICEAVGYQSEAAFNRVFKRSYGLAPGQYRRTLPRNAHALHPAAGTASSRKTKY